MVFTHPMFDHLLSALATQLSVWEDLTIPRHRRGHDNTRLHFDLETGQRLNEQV
jgi:hypothetical protein